MAQAKTIVRVPGRARSGTRSKRIPRHGRFQRRGACGGTCGPARDRQRPL